MLAAIFLIIPSTIKMSFIVPFKGEDGETMVAFLMSSFIKEQK